MKVHIDFKVRPATLADAPYVAASIADHLKEREGVEISEMRRDKILASVLRWLLEGSSMIHVAVLEKYGKERIIGVIAFDLVDDPYSDDLGVLVRNVYVARHYRNGEVERRLGASVLAASEALGASDISVMEPMRAGEL